jgi:hypothetical protein
MLDSTRIYPGPFVGAPRSFEGLRARTPLRASSHSPPPLANESNRDAAARDVSAVTGRVLPYRGFSSRPGQVSIEDDRQNTSPKAGLTFTFDYFAHAILLTRPDLR